MNMCGKLAELKTAMTWAAAVMLAIVWLGVACASPALASTTTVNVQATYQQTMARDVLSYVNNFRTGSDAWYWDSTDTTKVSCSGLSKLTYDYGLEKVAQQRAVEIAVYWSHTRPDGNAWSTAYGTTKGYSGENIAIGYSSAQAVFTGWEEADENYNGQGHRRNMLSSKFGYIGIGCAKVNGICCWVQEFSSVAYSTTATSADNSLTTVPVSINPDSASFGVSVSSNSLTLNEGASATLPTATAYFTYQGSWPSGTKIPLSASDISWSSSDGDIVTVSNGKAVGNKAGNATLSASLHGSSASIDTTVSHVIVADAAVSATCTTTGLTAGTHCSVCGETIIAQTVTPALGHKAGSPAEENRVEATYDAPGSYEQVIYCQTCGSEISRSTVTIPQLQKAAQPSQPQTTVQKLVVKPASCTYTASKLKKKAKKFKVRATGASGKLSYRVTKGSKKYITVSKAGKVTLKKRCKKGTYKVTVTAAATASLKAVSKTVTIKVK